MFTETSELEDLFKSTPVTPYSAYLYDSNNEINPKKIFTITNKRINYESRVVEVYVSELKKFVPHSKLIERVHQFFPN